MKTENDSNEISALSALLDFLSDRAIAHASFTIACFFGLFTVLSIMVQNQETLNIWLWIYWVFWSFGVYCFFSFSYYATYSEKTKDQIKSVLKKDIEKDILNEVMKGRKGLFDLIFFSFKAQKALIWQKWWVQIIYFIYYITMGVLPTFAILLDRWHRPPFLWINILFTILFLGSWVGTLRWKKKGVENESEDVPYCIQLRDHFRDRKI